MLIRSQCGVYAFLAVLLMAAFAVAQDSTTDRRERARREVVKAVLQAWRRDRPDEPIAVSVVELKTRDGRRVFPHGLRHLPEKLEKFGIYPATREPNSPALAILGRTHP